MSAERRLMFFRRGLICVTPFAIIGALYVSGRNQLLGLLIIVAFFGIALRFSRLQDKVEAQSKAAVESANGNGPQ
jgi:hypothetical protein